MNHRSAVRPDIVFYDRDDTPVMFAEVTGGAPLSDADAAEIGESLSSANGVLSVEWLAVVDRERVRLLRRGDGKWQVVETLSAPDVFGVYDPDFSKKQVFEHYLGVLAEAWLRDIAYHWKSENPPGFDVFVRLGLADRVAEGTTSTQPVRIFEGRGG